MSEAEAQNAVVVVINDLIFETKIRSAAQTLGLGVTFVRSTGALSGELDRARPAVLIVDLNTAGPDAVQAVAAGRAHPAKPFVVAFVSHVDQDLTARAQNA